MNDPRLTELGENDTYFSTTGRVKKMVRSALHVTGPLAIVDEYPWTITHRATGWAVARFDTLATAMRWMNKLAVLPGWETVEVDGGPRHNLPAKTREAVRKALADKMCIPFDYKPKEDPNA